VTGYRSIADDLRAAITSGEYRPGQTIPTLGELQDRYQVGKETARRAVAILQAEGLVAPIRRRGTVVRDRTPVRLSVARYRDVLAAPGDLGPWETATMHQGIAGRTDLIAVEQRPADAEISALLDVPAGTMTIHRLQHMLTGDRVTQVQQTWLPLSLAEGTPLAADGKIVGGIYRALAGLGHPPASAREIVTSRMPWHDEAEVLQLEMGSPVLTVTRITHDRAGTALVVTQAVMVGDRVQLVYDQAFQNEQG
jgi:GntR family transcriptional regulator